jgi:hypothetical protein
MFFLRVCGEGTGSSVELSGCLQQSRSPQLIISQHARFGERNPRGWRRIGVSVFCKKWYLLLWLNRDQINLGKCLLQFSSKYYPCSLRINKGWGLKYVKLYFLTFTHGCVITSVLLGLTLREEHRSMMFENRVKGKTILLQALRAPGGWGFQVFRQSAHEGSKVVSPTHRPPLPPRKDSRYSFLLEAESTQGP